MLSGKSAEDLRVKTNAGKIKLRDAGSIKTDAVCQTRSTQRAGEVCLDSLPHRRNFNRMVPPPEIAATLDRYDLDVALYEVLVDDSDDD